MCSMLVQNRLFCLFSLFGQWNTFTNICFLMCLVHLPIGMNYILVLVLPFKYSQFVGRGNEFMDQKVYESLTTFNWFQIPIHRAAMSSCSSCALHNIIPSEQYWHPKHLCYIVTCQFFLLYLLSWQLGCFHIYTDNFLIVLF